MENSNNVQHGHTSLAISLLSGSIAWLDAQTLDVNFKMFSSLISIAAGVMAIRYYHFNTKRIRNGGKKQ